MKNLHLLIFGSSEEEIRKNGIAAIEDALDSHKTILGDRANALCAGYEFEFVSETSMADITRG